jgi:asparagine synthase (glutamine-hydrolysing)
VQLGVFLSAGYESGIVAALAAQEGGGSLVAVTAGTLGSGYDERDAAGLIANHCGLDHRLLEVPAVSAGVLPRLMAELGEPFGDASLLPSYEVARAARREITVALTGDGGDEAFFGYATFRAAHLAERYRRLVPSRLRRMLHSRTDGITVDSWRRRAAALFEYGAGSRFADSFRNRMGFTPAQRAQLLRDGTGVRGHVAEHVYADRLRRWAALPDADALRRTFFETYLPNDYLTKVDTATMAASLEARCPFLDIDLVEFALSLPVEVAFPGGRLKALLRPLVRRHLPNEILRRPKAGFGVPVGQWFRGALRDAFAEFVCRPGTLMGTLVDPVVAREFLTAHSRGADHSTRLWALLALGVWSAVVVERRWARDEPLPVASPAAPTAR